MTPFAAVEPARKTLMFWAGRRGTHAELAFIFVVNLVTRLRSLVLLPVLFGVVGASAYGRWAVCASVAAVLANLAHGNIHTALLRQYAAAGDRRGTLVWTMLTAGVLGGLAMGTGLFICAGWVVRFVGLKAGDPSLLQVTAGLVVSHVLVDLTTNYYRARTRLRLFTVLDALPAFAEVGCIVVGVHLGWSLADALWLVVAFELLLSAACMVPLVRQHPFARPAAAELGQLLTFSIPTIPLSFGDSLMAQADRAVIAAVAGAAQAGIYVAAYSLSFVPLMVVRPLQVVLLVRLAPLWDGGDRDQAVQSLSLALKAYMALALPAAVGVAFIGPPLLELLTGRLHGEWTVGLLLCLGIGNALCGACYISVHALYLLKRTRAGGLVFIIGGAFNLVANLLLVPTFGLMGAALATLVAYALSFAGIMLLPRREFALKLGLPVVAKLLISTVALSGWLTMLGSSTPLALMASLFGGAVLHIGLLLGFRTFDESEQQMLLGRSSAPLSTVA